ncbi:MAG: hypothetical protein JSW40_07725 [Candidatus Omnitrophota bacterium]|nr:MAG: hypothetical protein JSW40_07725 [Candidatus Omnitrophota bacterium]
MKQKALTRNQAYCTLFVGALSAILALFFVVANLRATLLYEKATAEREPFLQSEKVEYYNRVFSLLSKAINSTSGNASYSISKADYLLRALSSTARSDLLVREKDVEQLYIKAVQLNPFYYEGHLKLGLFYRTRDAQKEKGCLLNAIQLYPTNYYPYLYLGKHYLAEGEEKEAFYNLMLALHHARLWYWYDVVKEIEGALKDSPHLSLEKQGKVLRFVVEPRTDEFDFKYQGFPHVKVPLKIIIHTERSLADPILYADDVFYSYFRLREGTREQNIYELYLESFPPGVYLDNFAIKPDLDSSLDIIEFIKELQPATD